MSAVNKSKQWIKSFIIKYGICPYAEKPFEQKQIRFKNYSSLTWKELRLHLLDEIHYLNQKPATQISNSFIIFSHYQIPFKKFFQDVAKLQTQLEKNHIHEFLLVVFHPKFYFKNSSYKHFTNQVNQSPYPSVHILRKAEFDQLAISSQLGKKISLRNKKFLTQLNANKKSQLAKP